MNLTTRQKRAGIKAMILANPSRFSYFKDNELKYITARKVHEQGSVSTNGSTPVGLGTSFGLYIFTEFDGDISENQVLLDGSLAYKVGAVDPHYDHGEIYEKRAKLLAVKALETCNITSFKIGSAVGIINNTLNTIAVTVPTGTNVTSLTPVITHNGKMIDKTTAQDFTNPVAYTVTAENLATRIYTVTVVVS